MCTKIPLRNYADNNKCEPQEWNSQHADKRISLDEHNSSHTCLACNLTDVNDTVFRPVSLQGGNDREALLNSSVASVFTFVSQLSITSPVTLWQVGYWKANVLTVTRYDQNVPKNQCTTDEKACHTPIALRWRFLDKTGLKSTQRTPVLVKQAKEKTAQAQQYFLPIFFFVVENGCRLHLLSVRNKKCEKWFTLGDATSSSMLCTI